MGRVDRNKINDNHSHKGGEGTLRESGSRASYRVAVQQGCIDSRSLFHDDNRVWIQHEGETYQLRRTRNGKLILTK